MSDPVVIRVVRREPEVWLAWQVTEGEIPPGEIGGGLHPNWKWEKGRLRYWPMPDTKPWQFSAAVGSWLVRSGETLTHYSGLDFASRFRPVEEEPDHSGGATDMMPSAAEVWLWCAANLMRSPMAYPCLCFGGSESHLHTEHGGRFAVVQNNPDGTPSSEPCEALDIATRAWREAH